MVGQNESKEQHLVEYRADCGTWYIKIDGKRIEETATNYYAYHALMEFVVRKSKIARRNKDEIGLLYSGNVFVDECLI